MKFHVIVEINGEEKAFTVEADNEIDAQHYVLQDINRSIVMKTCSPWMPDDTVQES